MNLKRVESKSKEFRDIWNIYLSSFSHNARRSLENQIKLFNNKLYNLSAIYYQSKLIGLIASWNFHKFIFIEHFAITKELRNKGLGTLFLGWFVSRTSKRIILEVPRPDRKRIAEKIIKFYKRLNFKLNLYNYTQPSYGRNKKAVPLYLMSYPRELNKSEFLDIQREIYRMVYGLGLSF